MTKEQVSLIISFVSMSFNAGSFFAKKKTGFLLMQATGIILLVITFLLTAEYSAMVGLGIGLGRVLTYFFFERKQKKPSVFWPILFSTLSIISYAVIEWIVLGNSGGKNVYYLIDLIALMGLGIGLGYVITHCGRKKKNALAVWPIFFSALSIITYVVIDWAVLGNAGWYNVFYLIGLVLYAFIFWIRDLKVMRHAAPAPTIFSIAFCVLSGADIFVIIAYSLELGANIVSIIKYHCFDKKKEKVKENEQEQASEDSAVDTLG